MTLRGYRIIAGLVLAVLLLAAGDYYFDWGLFNGAARPLMSGAMFLIVLLFIFMPAKVDREIQAQHEAQLEQDREWERTRDKSNDGAETARLRKAIGLPPNTSLERTREK